MKKSKIKQIVRNVVNEANGFDDDDMFPEEIRQFMSDEEKEEFLDDEPPAPDSGTYTLDDIVDTQVLRTRSAAGTKGFIDGTLKTLKSLMTDDDLMAALLDIKEDQKTFDDFAAARDAAIKLWVPSASKVLGQDASVLPELSDNMFLNGFLFDFWFMSTYIKPLERQMTASDKRAAKDLTPALQSVNERWKYMTFPKRVENFLTKVLTPAFEFLTRDTSVAG